MVSSLLVTLHDLILTVALALGGYLLGATPFALVVARRMCGVDIRRRGTGNVGAGNVYRELGAKAGGLVMACDVGKGLLPALAAVLLLPAWPAAFVAFMPTLGHQHSVFLRGSGGKGIATAAGAALALTPLVFVITLVPWLLVVRVRRLMRYAPLLAGATYLTASFILPLPAADRALAVVVCASVLWAYRRELWLLRLRSAEANAGSR